MMKTSNLPLDKPTNRTVTGPTFLNEGSQVVVKYDYEHDNGKVEWVQVIFMDVLLFEYREASCCNEEDIVGQAKFVAPLSHGAFMRH